MLSLKLPLILIVVFVVLVHTEDDTNGVVAVTNETSTSLPNPEPEQPKEPSSDAETDGTELPCGLSTRDLIFNVKVLCSKRYEIREEYQRAGNSTNYGNTTDDVDIIILVNRRIQLTELELAIKKYTDCLVDREKWWFAFWRKAHLKFISHRLDNVRNRLEQERDAYLLEALKSHRDVEKFKLYQINDRINRLTVKMDDLEKKLNLPSLNRD